MSKVSRDKAIAACADPQRAKHFWEQLEATAAGPKLRKGSAEQMRVLTALLSGSQALSNQLVAHPEWTADLTPENLAHPRQAQGLSREVESCVAPLLEARDYAEAFDQLRQFRAREMLRIATRDLARIGSVVEITREISSVAGVCLDAVWRICNQQLTERFGQPYHLDPDGAWQPTAFAVIGLGKLGGQELNYSSDVDVVFVYSEEGQVFREPPAKGTVAGRGMSNHEFFKRLAESFTSEVARMTPRGVLFRIDLRLRPEGDAGPLVRSLASYENYYAQWGQTWERMMLIKARCVAADAALGAEFLEMVQPFRYPRSIAERVLSEIADMKARIENEVVKAGEIDRNVKLGRGGIREIEFIVQSLQLLNAGRQPFLQGAQTLPGLEKLAQYNLLDGDDAAALAKAYGFLREVEHRLQMEDNQQTHTIPTQRQARERLAALMGFDTLKAFESALRSHTKNVRRVYEEILKSDDARPKSELPRGFEGHEGEWKKLLAGHAFREPDKAVRMLNEFANGPGFVHVSARTVDLARQLIPRLLALCPKVEESKVQGPRSKANSRGKSSQILSDPDRVLTRLDSFITAYGTRAMLFEMWTSNPSLFDLLLLLFDRSEFLAETAIRTPDLVDELVLSGRLRQSKSAAETLKDLSYGLEDEDQHLWLRRYHQAELMRIGLRDILGLSDFEQNLTELSALADACLQYALEVVLRKRKLKKSPLVVIGMGKLGGREVGYGSDLDIVFVTGGDTKTLPQLQRIAADVMDLLSTRTAEGIVFPTDARLRPDGEKGLLVNSLAAYEEYYRQRAHLWEIQSLSRSRRIAGDLELGARFQSLAAVLTDFREENVANNFSAAAASTRGSKGADKKEAARTTGLGAWSADWREKIHAMRMRIERERTPAGQNELAIKTGTGGLIDAEFIAQTLCLARGWQEPNTSKALERARDSKALPKSDADKLIENYRQLRRVEGILRRWSYEGETVLPDDPAPYYRVSVRCGFATPEEFRNALANWRAAIREVYNKVFQA